MPFEFYDIYNLVLIRLKFSQVAVVTIFCHCILALRPLNDNSMCNDQFAFKYDEKCQQFVL